MAKNILNATDASFAKDVIDSSNGKPVLVDFWAEWCGPCRSLAPKLEEIATQAGEKISIVKVDIDENPNSPTQLGVRGIPTMVLFKNGQEVDRLVGNQPKEAIISLLQRHGASI